MATSKLKATGLYLNPYEKAYDISKSNKFFTEAAWLKAEDNGDLDQYIDAMNRVNSIDKAEFDKKYNIEFSNTDTYLSSLYNEAYADREVKDREIPVYDEQGNQTGTEIVKISDYDYYLQSLKEVNDYNMKLYNEELLRSQKAARNGWQKFWGFAGSAGGTALHGIVKGVDNITEFLGAFIAGGVNAIAQNKNYFEAVGDEFESDRWRLLEQTSRLIDSKGLEQSLMQFEMQHGWRDPVTGEFNSPVSEVISGVVDTIAQMIPSSQLGRLAGVSSSGAKLGLGGTAMLGQPIVNTAVQSGVAMGTFYTTTEFGQSYKRSYEIAKASDTTVDYAKLMATTALSTIVKAGITVGMNKLFGGTALEKYMFGIDTKTSSFGKINNLFVRGLFRLVGDGLQEGTEEVLQDIADALVNDMFLEDSAMLSTMSAEDLALTFVTAALAGVIGTGAGVLSTERQQIVVDGKIKKLTKTSSYMLALDFNNIQSNLDAIMRLSANDKTGKYQAALKNIYNSARMIGTVFGEIGEERANNVLSALNRINDAVKNGKFDAIEAKRSAQKMAAEILGDETYFDIEGKTSIVTEGFSRLTEEVRQAGLTDIVEKIVKNEDVGNIDSLTDEQKSKIKAIMDNDTHVKRITVTKKGHDVVVTDKNDSIALSKDTLDSNSAPELMKYISGKRLVKAIINNNKLKMSIPNLLQMYKDFTGVTKATENTAVQALLSDVSFYTVVLSQANKEGIEILSQLVEMSKESAVGVSNKIYVNLINKYVKNMIDAYVQFAKYQPAANINLDFLSDEQRESIKDARYSNDVGSRLVNKGKVVDSEIKFLRAKVNYLPIKQSEKDYLLKMLFDEKWENRSSAWLSLQYKYKVIAHTMYDGEIYMPQSSVANHTFNAWLQNNNLTLKNILSVTLTEAEIKECLNLFGDARNSTNILKYRQYQFSTYTNNTYTFQYNSKGKINVHDERTGNIVGYNDFVRKVELFKSKGTEDKRVYVAEKSHFNLVERLVNDRFDNIEKKAFNINDIVTNPDYLTDDLQASIKSKYGSLTVENAYYFLKDYISKYTKGDISLTVMADGTIAFADVKNIKDFVTDDKSLDAAIDELINEGVIEASKFIKDKYLHGKLKNVFFALKELGGKVGGTASTTSNAIYINKNYNNKELLKYTILHEFVHKVQDVNKQNFGFTSEWLLNLIRGNKISKANARLIIEDVRKHVPELFDAVDYEMYKNQAKLVGKTFKPDDALDKEARLVSDFIYYSCGEINAYGLENLLSFYPTIVSTNKITMPWGTSYDYDSGKNAEYLLRRYINPKYFMTSKGKLINAEDVDFPTLIVQADEFQGKDYDTIFAKRLDAMHIVKMSTLDEEMFKNFADKINDFRVSKGLSKLNYTTTYDVVNKYLTNYSPLNMLPIAYVGEDLHKYYDWVYEDDIADGPYYQVYQEMFSGENFEEFYKMLKLEQEKIKQNNTVVTPTETPIIARVQEIIKEMGEGYDAYVDKEQFEFLEKHRELATFVELTLGVGKTRGQDVKLTDADVKNIANEYVKTIQSEYYSMSNIFYILDYLKNWPKMGGQLSKAEIDELNVRKQRIVDSITEESRQTMIKTCWLQMGAGVSFEEFLDTDLPYIRVTGSEDIYSSPFHSAYLGYDGLQHAFHSMLYGSFHYGIDEDVIYIDNDMDREFAQDRRKVITALIGTIKPRDILAFIPTGFNETLLTDEQLSESTTLRLSVERDMELKDYAVYLYDNLTEKTTIIGNKERVSEFRDSTGQGSENIDATRPDAVRNTDVWEEIEESDYSKKPKAGYTSRRIFRNVLTGKIKTFYSYKGAHKQRQVSKKVAGDNANLQKYIGQQISPELQKFVSDATQQNAGKYFTKIEKGELTTKDVLEDFRSGKISDEKTFKLFNKAFFQNDSIKSAKQLEDIVASAPVYWTNALILKQLSGLDETELEALSMESVFAITNVLLSNKNTKEVYDKVYKRYSVNPMNGSQLEVDEEYLRMLLMKYYDGTVEGARKAISLARTMAISDFATIGIRRVSSKKGGAVTIEKQIADGLTIADTLGDTSYDILDELDKPREELIANIIEHKRKNLAHKIEQGIKQGKKLKDVDALYDKLLAWEKQVKRAPIEQLKEFYRKVLISEVKNTNVDVTETKEDSAEDLVYKTLLYKNKNVTKNRVRGIQGHIQTIKRNLTKKDYKRFLSDNSDIFNDDLTLKDEVLHDKDSAGRLVYKSDDVIKAIKDRLYKLSQDVRDGKYSSAKAFTYAKKLEREVKSYKKQLVKKLSKPSTKGNYESVTIVEQDRSITVNTNTKIPDKLVPLLNYALNDKADTNIQYISEENEMHQKVSLVNFVDDNADYLSTLSQKDVEDIVNFYLTSDVIPSTNDAVKYVGIQIMTLSYIHKCAQKGMYLLDAETLTSIENRLKVIVGGAATWLDNWRVAMKQFKPEEQIVSHFYEQYSIEVTSEQLHKVQDAFESKSPEKMARVRKEIYEDLVKKNSKKYIKEQEKALENATGVKTEKSLKTKLNSMFEKLWEIERAFMLSSPGTWIRNQVSNTLIGGVFTKNGKEILPGLNTMSGKVGNFVAKLLPKKWKKEGQWKIIGTQVTSDVKTYIKQSLFDSGLMDMIGDSMNKYDTRKFDRKKGVKTSDVFSELITRKLAQDVFNGNHKIAAFMSKMLSDDRYIRQATVKYYGKLLTEDATKIKDDNGNIISTMTGRTTELFVEAYVLAAQDFMHKSNFMNKLDTLVHEKAGSAAYFAYKQFFPFASSTVNWFSESLNYTPLGLAKAIINFAKLENQIDKLEAKREQGETVVSGKFAQYIATRNIGKGVIGTVGTLLGILLAGLGGVRLDEEDEKYKLVINNTKIDISEVFGTQGVLLGIGVAQGIVDNKNAWQIFRETLNTMFDDSIYTSVLNTFKYNEDNFADTLTQYITYNIPNAFIPNFLKTLSSVARKYDVKYSSGILGKLERLAVSAIPGLDRAFPAKYDVYTGEAHAKYTFSDYFVEFINKLGVVKFSNYEMSNTEQLAILLGVRNGELTGRYEVNGEKFNLNAKQTSAINQLYGKLNKKDLADFTNNRKSYKVEGKDGKYVTLKFNKMNDKQKAAVIERIMNHNSSIAKIYALTKTGKYKYYASEEDYLELKKLGISNNVYVRNNKYEGFVKIK